MNSISFKDPAPPADIDDIASDVFQATILPVGDVSESISIQGRLNKARLWDTWIKIGVRLFFTVFFVILLSAQNIVVFRIVFEALFLNRLQDLQIIFGVLVTATLTETYFIARTIVEWMYKEIDYKSS